MQEDAAAQAAVRKELLAAQLAVDDHITQVCVLARVAAVLRCAAVNAAIVLLTDVGRLMCGVCRSSGRQQSPSSSQDSKLKSLVCICSHVLLQIVTSSCSVFVYQYLNVIQYELHVNLCSSIASKSASAGGS